MLGWVSYFVFDLQFLAKLQSTGWYSLQGFQPKWGGQTRWNSLLVRLYKLHPLCLQGTVWTFIQLMWFCLTALGIFTTTIIIITLIMKMMIIIMVIVTCGQIVSTMTEICSARETSPVNRSTRASKGWHWFIEIAFFCIALNRRWRIFPSGGKLFHLLFLYYQ